ISALSSASRMPDSRSAFRHLHLPTHIGDRLVRLATKHGFVGEHAIEERAPMTSEGGHSDGLVDLGVRSAIQACNLTVKNDAVATRDLVGDRQTDKFFSLAGQRRMVVH